MARSFGERVGVGALDDPLWSFAEISGCVQTPFPTRTPSIVDKFRKNQSQANSVIISGCALTQEKEKTHSVSRVGFVLPNLIWRGWL